MQAHAFLSDHSILCWCFACKNKTKIIMPPFLLNVAIRDGVGVGVLLIQRQHQWDKMGRERLLSSSSVILRNVAT